MKLLAALAGALLGAVALSLLTLLFHWVFFRAALRDGQYAFVFFLTVPGGAVLGATTGLILACLSQGQTGLAWRIALFGGGLLMALFLLLGLFAFSGTENPTLLERLSATLFWVGLPLLWSGLLVWTGQRLFKAK